MKIKNINLVALILSALFLTKNAYGENHQSNIDTIKNSAFSITLDGHVITGLPIGFISTHEDIEYFDVITAKEPSGRLNEDHMPTWQGIHWKWPSYAVYAKQDGFFQFESGFVKSQEGVEFTPWYNMGIGYVYLPNELDTPDGKAPPVIHVFDDSRKNVIGTMRDLALVSPSSTKYSDERIVHEIDGEWLKIGPDQWVKFDLEVVPWEEHYQEDELAVNPSGYMGLVSIIDQPLVKVSGNEIENHHIQYDQNTEDPIITRNKYLYILKTEGNYAFVVLMDTPDSDGRCFSLSSPQGFVGWIRYLDDNGFPLIYGNNTLC